MEYIYLYSYIQNFLTEIFKYVKYMYIYSEFLFLKEIFKNMKQQQSKKYRHKEGWGRAEPGTNQERILVSYLDGRDPRTWTIIYCLARNVRHYLIF